MFSGHCIDCGAICPETRFHYLRKQLTDSTCTSSVFHGRLVGYLHHLQGRLLLISLIPGLYSSASEAF